MTVIAGKVYDNKIILGADSQTSYGSAITTDTKKLHRVNSDFVWGGSGYSYESQLLRIFTKTHQPESNEEGDIVEFMVEFHDWCTAKITTTFVPKNWFLVVLQNKLISIAPSLDIIYHDYWAIGSGWEYARAALYLGHSVDKSIQVACELTAWCNGPVEILEIPKKK